MTQFDALPAQLIGHELLDTERFYTIRARLTRIERAIYGSTGIVISSMGAIIFKLWWPT